MKKKEVVVLKPAAPRIFVVGGGYDYIRMFFNMGFKGAKGLGDCEIACFTGGEDVDPALYGEAPLKGTNYNSVRDERERVIYEAALEAKIPMVGICRGGQFLNVMNDGKMWQHVDGHTKYHPMTVTDAKGKALETFQVSSTHHQMMIPGDEGEVLAVASEAQNKIAEGIEWTAGKPEAMADVEVVYYSKTNCLCFQPHPEYRDAPVACTKYFQQLLDNLIIPFTVKEEK